MSFISVFVSSAQHSLFWLLFCLALLQIQNLKMSKFLPQDFNSEPKCKNGNEGESAEIDDIDITEDPYYYRTWLNPQGTIKLGIPPQDFIVAFSTRSPDTFVAQSGSVKWDNFLTFDKTKSYTYSSDGDIFKDSIFSTSTNPYILNCDNHNTGVLAKDLVTLGDTLVLPLKFGLIQNVTMQQCMDWKDSDIEGMFGLALFNSSNGIPSTLEQIAPILDEPVFSVLTDIETVNEINKQLGGELYYWQDYINYIPCEGNDMPLIVITMGNNTHRAEWIIPPEEYSMEWYEDRCLSLFQHHTWFGAWTSLAYHTKNCFAIRFGSEGNMIGMARPIGGNKLKKRGKKEINN
uniref:Peptidase A1 domain-containing protein n=1 Tax=Meloidogyne hapla TaxID=6305 RepID=A0A1I8BAS2_MELHA